MRERAGGIEEGRGREKDREREWVGVEGIDEGKEGERERRMWDGAQREEERNSQEKV